LSKLRVYLKPKGNSKIETRQIAIKIEVLILLKDFYRMDKR